MCSAKALSKYTEMVDSLIREQMDALAAASDEARLKLREWELPECLQVLPTGALAFPRHIVPIQEYESFTFDVMRQCNGVETTKKFEGLSFRTHSLDFWGC